MTGRNDFLFNPHFLDLKLLCDFHYLNWSSMLHKSFSQSWKQLSAFGNVQTLQEVIFDYPYLLWTLVYLLVYLFDCLEFYFLNP